LLPCVDALNAKAALQLSLIHPTNTLTVANSRALLSNRRLSNDWQLSVFEETPLISPHHFAFVILPSEYASVLVVT
jgi:aminopeptidase N